MGYQNGALSRMDRLCAKFHTVAAEHTPKRGARLAPYLRRIAPNSTGASPYPIPDLLNNLCAALREGATLLQRFVIASPVPERSEWYRAKQSLMKDIYKMSIYLIAHTYLLQDCYLIVTRAYVYNDIMVM